MLKNATWQFPPNQGGIQYDFQDASRAHFAGNPVHHLVREVIQNSLDAKDKGFPTVKITFTELTAKRDEICVIGLPKHVKSCLDEAIRDSNSEAEKAYSNALDILNSEQIRCLKIQDSGTTGLQGRNWDALVYKEGAVQKEGSAPGGSFGIGKNAVFNVTDIYTVFYCTRYLNQEKKKGRVEQMQGKSRLMTHPDPDSIAENLQHVGFFRMPDGNPIEGTEIPPFFRLDQTGTGIFIVGFNPRSETWVDMMTSAVIENFFYAIHHKRLTVRIVPAKSSSPNQRKRRGTRLPSQPVNINHETIDHIFQSQQGKPSYHYHYYQTIRDKEAINTPEIARLGPLDVHLAIGSGPRRTAYINRNGMLITDSTEQRTNPIAPRRRSLWPDYTSVVVPTTDRGDKWLRAMENPSHDSILPGHLREPKDQRDANTTLKQARVYIRKIIDDETEVDQHGDTINLEELAAWFPDEFNPDGPGNKALPVQTIYTKPLRIGAIMETETDDPYDTTLPETEDVVPPRPPKPPGPDPPDPPDSLVPTPPSPPGDISVPAKPPRLLRPRIISNGIRELIIAFTASDDKPVRLALIPRGCELLTPENRIMISYAAILQPEGRDISLDDGIVLLAANANERIRVKVTTDRDIENQAFTVQSN